MSIGYTFVLADDNNFYEDPTFCGDDYFLCFDEDEDPELVIKKMNRTEEQLEKRAIEILDWIGIKYSSIRQNKYCGSRFFGKKSMKPAVAYFVDINKPIPANKITNYKFILKKRMEGTYLYFDNQKIYKELKNDDK